ncbi:hypothetical protein [Paractinoplanes atraurantiacus]|uniref:MmpS family membrane protein n=1 Tax=Paractinoplanes atraurantiacus TaxID=1036182 RepID=A0A285IHA5_9ACTN|nr:hypothetical protein [Actinoplanes atraurantiacus]SNY47349.1 hypothetical protein SAMN05421748_108119 [Actinoplanes atraurantiacus]
MRRQIEVALVAVVAALVGAAAYHAVDTWPRAAETPQPQTISIPAATFRISAEAIRIDVNPLPLTFEVTGTGPIDVTYSPDATGRTTHARVKAPWKVTVQAPPYIPANAVTLTARTTSAQDDAVVTCRIVTTEFGGTALGDDTASGPHAVANC